MSKKQNMEEIYLENRYWVYGSFLRKTGEIETAEDLSQTLWLRFFQNLLEADNIGQDAVHAEAFPEDAIDDIEAVYKELSEEECLLLSLKYEGRYTSREIGAVIGISPSLVRMRLSRITEKLRKQMKKRNE